MVLASIVNVVPTFKVRLAIFSSALNLKVPDPVEIDVVPLIVIAVPNTTEPLVTVRLFKVALPVVK